MSLTASAKPAERAMGAMAVSSRVSIAYSGQAMLTAKPERELEGA
ncbi:hypothetical protein [Sphaerisporangium album]|nr:hypothetical protein [Sphaerisporangium album]